MCPACASNPPRTRLRRSISLDSDHASLSPMDSPRLHLQPTVMYHPLPHATSYSHSASAAPPSIPPAAPELPPSRDARAGPAGISPFRLLITLIMVAMLALPVCFYLLYRLQKSRSDVPLQQLRAFALQEATNNRLDTIADLSVDGLKLYAQATCVKGESVAQVRHALRAQMRNIPEAAREDIISSAVIEGMDAVSTRQDTAADLVDSSKAFSYLAYWNTKYNGDHVLLSDRYSTCIMAAGVDVKVGEELAGYEESSKRVQIGTRPCECGMLWCVGRCPEYETVVTKRPVYKRHRLTLKNQVELHRWMVKQAVGRAESLMLTRELLDRRSRTPVGEVSSVSWQAPQGDYYLGEDSVDLGKTPQKEMKSSTPSAAKQEL